jgi:exosortase
MTTALQKPERYGARQLQTAPDNRWWGALWWCLLAAAFLYLYAAVLPPLVADWTEDPNYSHGFLVPFLSAYFVWERRYRLATAIRAPRGWGLLVLLLGLCMLFLGHIGAELFLMRSSMIVAITGLVLYLLGSAYVRILAFPIAFLLFMIPLPAILLNTITFPLQLLAAKLSTFSLQLVTLPVYREGNIIFLPHTTLEIVEACSGIRSLVSLVALAVVFAYISQRQSSKRWVLILSAVPIALVANAFRIWGTGVLAYLYGTKVAEGFYHTFAGWLVFVVAFILLLGEGCILSLLWRKQAPMRGEQNAG